MLINFEIDKSRVTEIRMDGNAYYTMPLLGPENEYFSFYNVVVCEFKDKDPEAFLLGYFPDDNYITGLQTGETTRFTGDTTIQTLDYEKALNSNSCYTTVVPMCSNVDGGHRRGEACDPDYYYTASFTTCVIGSLDSPGGGPGPGGGHPGDSGFDGASGNGGGSTTSSNLPFDFATEPISHLDTSSYNLLKVTLGITDRDQLHYLWIKPLIAEKLFDFIKDNSYSSPAKEFAKKVIYAKTYEDFNGIYELPLFQQDPYSVWGKLSQKEKDLIESFPMRAYNIFQNRPIAEAETIRRFNKNGVNDKSDAFRHAYFNALNSRKIGKYYAGLFSDAHESDVSTALRKEKEMDLFNNNIGHSFATGFPGISNAGLSNEVYKKVTDGSLRYLSPINKSDPNYRITHGITTNTKLVPTNK